MKNVRREIDILNNVQHPNIIKLYKVIDASTTVN